MALHLKSTGIDFTDFGDATETSELFDDYEEGNHTTTPSSGTGSWTLGTYNTLSYTKIGRLVTINGEVRCTAVSSPSGACYVQAPFSCDAGTHLSTRGGTGMAGWSVNFGASATYCFSIIFSGAADVYLYGLQNNTARVNVIPDVQAEYCFNFSYHNA